MWILSRTNAGPIDTGTNQTMLAPRLAKWMCATLLCSVGTMGMVSGASPEGDEPAGGLISRQAIALNPVTGKVYAVDTQHDSIVVIDDIHHVATPVKVGKSPVAIALNSATDTVYVANHGGGSVSVIDGKSDAVEATVAVGSLPYAMTVDVAGNTIYISNVFNQTLTAIKGDTNQTTSTNLGSFDAMLVDPKMDRAYLLGYESASMTVLDTKTQQTSHAPMGMMHLWGMALNPVSHELFVTRIGNGDVISYNGESRQSSVMKTGQYPCAVAVNVSKNMAYVANYLDGSITVIDGRLHLAVATLKVGEQPEAIAVDETTDRVYVANTKSNSVSIIDGRRNAVIETRGAGLHPYAIVVGPRHDMVYVANAQGAPFTQIDVGRAAAHPER